ncbi:MAG: ASCH domain-containing protein [Myxococcales bacterium]|nr:ASCH domain-containing protein [Myxococcales bacterium]
MNIPSHVQAFWKQFEAAVGRDVSARFYEAFHFDDNEADANELGDLVLQGTKRATASLLWLNEAKNQPVPQVGALSVVTNWQQEPLCVIETIQVDIAPYEEVGEAFAAAEGEGDGSLRYWREVHWLYFSRECARLGKQPSLTMPVVCERFTLAFSSKQ